MGSKNGHASDWVVARSSCLVAVAVLLLLAAWEAADGHALATLSAQGDPMAALSRLDFAAALTAGCSLLLLGCAAWWLLVTVLVAAEAVAIRGHSRDLRCLRRACPTSVRRLLLAACGVAVATGVAGPALAAGGHAAGAGAADAPRVTRPVADGRLAGLALPDRLTAPEGLTTPTAQPEPTALEPTALVVRPGDSLWALARRLLPDDASETAIAAGCRALYRANADRLGPDPDLIYPGTRLDLPELDPPSRKESR